MASDEKARSRRGLDVVTATELTSVRSWAPRTVGALGDWIDEKTWPLVLGVFGPETAHET